MRITLVYPRFDYAGGILDEEPLGVLYIAAALRAAGHSVSVVDLTFEPTLEPLNTATAASDIIGLSFSSPLFGRAKRVLEYIRSLKPDAIVIAGGAHPTILPQQVAEAGFDYVFIGEGERSVVNFVSAFASGTQHKVRGIGYFDNSLFRQTAPEPFIHELDSLPFPARDLIDYRRYVKKGAMSQVGMIATRGCPFGCSFCKPTLDKLFGRFRKRSAENVAEEIEQLFKDFGPNVGIFFKDDTMTLLGQDWFEELALALARKRLRPQWHCSSRVDTVNPKLLAVMKRCGCKVISFGVESGSQRILDFYNKGITPSQVQDAFRWCRQAGIDATANVILGAPDETKEDLQATYDLLKRIKPSDVYVYFCSALPETKMYWAIRDAGRLAEITDYDQFDNVRNKSTGKTNVRMRFLAPSDLKEYERRIERLNVFRKMRSPRTLARWANKAIRQPDLLGARIRSVIRKACG